MTKLSYLLLVWAICECVLSEDDKNSFVDTYEFSPVFGSGPLSLASSPVSSQILQLDTSQYPQHFDTVVSSSIDSIQKRAAPRDRSFSPERFGFNPIASQAFLSTVKPKSPPPRPQQYREPAPLQYIRVPLQYDIKTEHDPVYKIYKTEENGQQEILSSLKQNPAVSSYFKPGAINAEVSHPATYRRDADDNSESVENYRPNAYVAGAGRIRRYSDGRKRQHRRESSDEEDSAEDTDHYRAEYVAKPKAFDSELYSGDYKEDKEKEDDNPYDYDSGYDHKEYERIKDLSEKQAAEIKQNKGNCVDVVKDGMRCTTCKDKKTGGNFESCSYVAEPKNNKYAYSKERKFDSNDEPEGEPAAEEEPRGEGRRDSTAPQKFAKLSSAPEQDSPDSTEKYQRYYSDSPQQDSERAQARDDDASEEKTSDESLTKPYNYKQALPGFYSDNEPKKDVEHVLAEFKKKDRSSCKKVQKNGMTCFQCIDKSGQKNEECMYVSESAPQRSHLAYQELKEFTSRPATLSGNDEAESRIVTTNAPLPLKSAAYVAANDSYGRKLKRKKAVAVTAAPAPASPLRVRKARSVEDEEAEARAAIIDEAPIAPPEEFAGDSSKAAFWAETAPRHSGALGVTLPRYMLARSEHEAAFDETVAGA
ncbi:uncharacterized protein LOC125489055 [Plutella xylostella]|uniref:uncharacterized protein LOC125489055 n=1 Tax=Plutella xylostella TaxID=51655 RepID=UPI0020326FAF|nr:uncharacterized protein LOC125489055 [Plutella xylostella]